MNKRIRKKKGLSKIRKEELWNLDCTIIKFILPRLQKFKQLLKDNKSVHSYPANLKNMKEWIDIIDKMIWSFQFALDIYELNYSSEYRTSNKNWNKYKQGMNLFVEYLMNLWD